MYYKPKKRAKQAGDENAAPRKAADRKRTREEADLDQPVPQDDDSSESAPAKKPRPRPRARTSANQVLTEVSPGATQEEPAAGSPALSAP